MKLFYISYATDENFLGATVLESNDHISVLKEATKHGLNPGGQAAVFELPYEALEAPDIRMMQGKLVSKEELLSMGGIRHGDLDENTQNKFEAHSMVVDQ